MEKLQRQLCLTTLCVTSFISIVAAVVSFTASSDVVDQLGSQLSINVQLGLLLLILPIYALGFATCYFLFAERKGAYHTLEQEPAKELLHWVDGLERRGIGDAIERINHLAIIVEDVGRSLAFYVEVMGFQQIRRPNFDRHGAWLTVGNTELHLIKGRPCVPDGEDLIVGHIALETSRPMEVLNKLVEMNIPFRQNVSVPDPIKSGNNREENFDSAEGKVTQFFVRDPDGYYLEICNCDILTKFCLMKEDALREKMQPQIKYREGMPNVSRMSIGLIARIVIVVKRMKKRVRANLRKSYAELLEEKLQDIEPADEVDEEKLKTLLRRRKTYCDIIQGYSEANIREALLLAGNNIPVAILVLKADRGDIITAIPPSYLCSGDDENVTHVEQSLQPRRFYIEVQRCGTAGSEGLARQCKPFNDRKPSKVETQKQENPDKNEDTLSVRLASKCTTISRNSRKNTRSTTDTGAIPGLDSILPGVPVEIPILAYNGSSSSSSGSGSGSQRSVQRISFEPESPTFVPLSP